ncbi:hypothetical protein [Glutamicibacter sp.]|nr:hypothetical protein [Glutamicibacter sp.]HJX79719.1 hypothetical protein [Glutamicibacter sp.]
MAQLVAVAICALIALYEVSDESPLAGTVSGKSVNEAGSRYQYLAA